MKKEFKKVWGPVALYVRLESTNESFRISFSAGNRDYTLETAKEKKHEELEVTKKSDE